ncbi:MAG: RNA-binding protein [Thaumarchaeota archaeon]|nr:RNA-binding protein [Nitrososphaerota archaeon]
MSQKQVQLPLCTSCNRPIMPGEKAAKFSCPQCGGLVIWRCEKCRTFARLYRCINCSFEGP